MTAEVRKETFQKGSTIETESENLLWENNEESKANYKITKQWSLGSKESTDSMLYPDVYFNNLQSTLNSC